MTQRDVGAVCALLNGERVAGQPTVTPETLVRDAPVDSWCHDQLDDLVTVVAERDGRVAAAVCYGTDARGVRCVVWTAGESDRAALDAVISAAVDRWNGPVSAWSFAPRHSAGLEGLPAAVMPNTDSALRAAGFVASGDWVYLRHSVPARTGRLSGRAELWEPHEQVIVNSDGAAVAEWEAVLIADDPHLIGAVWWLECYARHRGCGHGRRAFTDAVNWLYSVGAQEVILFIDDEGRTRGDRVAARALYDASGFEEVSRLWSYTRSAPRTCSGKR